MFNGRGRWHGAQPVVDDSAGQTPQRQHAVLLLEKLESSEGSELVEAEALVRAEPHSCADAITANDAA